MQPLSLAIKQLATLATTKITSHLEVTDCGLELKDVHSHDVTTPLLHSVLLAIGRAAVFHRQRKESELTSLRDGERKIRKTRQERKKRD